MAISGVHWRGAWLLSAQLASSALLVGGSAAAQPPPGIYAMENGGIVEITGGGDVSAKTRFGTAAYGVGAGCLGPNDDLYVVTSSGSTPGQTQVVIATAGGNLDMAPIHATSSVPGLLTLVCTKERILAAFFDGFVQDMTAPGDYTNVAPVVWGLESRLFGLLMDSGGTLWAGNDFYGIFDVSAGGDMSNATPYFHDGLYLAEYNGNLYATEDDLGRIYDFTGGTGVGYIYATVPTGYAYISAVPGAGLLLSSQTSGGMIDVSGGGDLTMAAPYVYGLNAPTSTVVVVSADCGDGLLQLGELCDGGGETVTCDVDCTPVVCGDGVTNATAAEACDTIFQNANCDADCTLPQCGDGLHNAAAGELCDDAGPSATCDVDCTPAECGDGIANSVAGEDCDDAGESAVCNDDCTAALCGDGKVNNAAGENCDDGGESVMCDTNCTLAYCSDGDLNMLLMEECDDGNVVNGDGCSSDCKLEDASGGAGGAAGAGGGGVGGGGVGGAGAGGGAGGSSGDTITTGNCGCRTAGGSGSAPWGAMLFLLSVAALTRRGFGRRGFGRRSFGR